MVNQTNYWLYEADQKAERAYLEATVGIGMTDRHYKLKTSDRGENPVHCREAIQIAMGLSESKMKSVCARYGCTTKQLLKASTGRPKKHKVSNTVLAETKADTILNDLRKAAGRQVKAGTYKAGKIMHPDDAKTLEEEINQVLAYAEEQNEVILKREIAAEERKAKRSAKAPVTSKKRKTA